MKLCFSTLGCPEWNWDDIISVAKDLHYSGIEIRGVKKELYAPAIAEFKPDRIDAFKKRLSDRNLSIVCLTSACYLHKKDVEEQTVKEAKEYIDTASRLGVPYVRVLGDTNPAPETTVDDGFVRSQLEKIADYAADKNVLPLIETNGVYADTSRLARVIKDLKVGVLWDVHHPYRYFSESPEKTLGYVGQSVKHVHLKDSLVTQGKVKYTMMGYGDVPVAECINGLLGLDYDGFFSLEWVKRWDLSLEEPGIAFAQFASFINVK